VPPLVHPGDPVAGLGQHRCDKAEGLADVAHARDAQDQRRVVGAGDVVGQTPAGKIEELGLWKVATVHSRNANIESHCRQEGRSRSREGAQPTLQEDSLDLVLGQRQCPTV
jgi:hypothetical protein